MGTSRVGRGAAAALAALVVALAAAGASHAKTLTGTNGPDVLRGTSKNDHIDGRGGNDQIFGLAGNDVLIGGRGKDRISAGAGADVVRVADGKKDTVVCGSGLDVVTADATDAVAADCELVNPQLLTVTVDGGGIVTSTPAGIVCPSACSKQFSRKSSVRLAAEANSGSRFTGWSGGGCSGLGACTIHVPATVTATFKQQYQLTIAASPAGAGMIASSPAGISCPATCVAPFDVGTAVTLTPQAQTGFQFTGWSGACSGAAACTVTMDAAKTVTATFTPLYSLNVSVTGHGKVTSVMPGIDCPTTCTKTYLSGATVDLVGTADPGYRLASWSGACTGTGGCSVTMNSAHDVTATFERILYPLTVVITPSMSGSVVSNPTGISCPGGSCTMMVPSDTVVALTETPSMGYLLHDWSACPGIPSECDVTMDGPKTVTVTFGIPRQLTVSIAMGVGQITSDLPGISCPGDCTEVYANGLTVNITATPGGGYGFSYWSPGGACSNMVTNPCPVTMNADRTAAANFGL